MKISEIKKIAEREFGEQPSSVEEIEEGLKQETYRLTFGKDKYILQLSDKLDEGDNGLERNIKAYQLLKDTEVPVPELVTEQLQRYKDDSQEWKYYISECLPGKSLESQMTPELTKESGKILAKLHNFQSYDKAGWLLSEENGFSVVPFEEGSFKEYVLNEWQDRINTLEKEGWDKVVRKSQEFYENYGSKLPENIESVFCPNDFSTDNIMVEDREIKGVIDFDIAYAGHSQRDLVKSANGFWMIDPGEDKGIRENFYDGYWQEKEFEESFSRNEPIYRVETLTQLVASLIEMNHFNEEEKSFYREHLKRIIEEAEEELTEVSN